MTSSATEASGIGRTLRSGGGAGTRLELLDGEPVVLRHLHVGREAGEWRTRLERDLEIVGRARSPHLVPHRVLRADADGVTVARPFVAGQHLRAWATDGPDDAALVRAFRELVEALAVLHRHGLVHGGVKPGNVILAGDVRRVVLVDALVSRTQIAGSGAVASFEVIRRTPDAVADAVADADLDVDFLSPEQAGVLHRAVGPAADLYVAGWTILDALAARGGGGPRPPGPCASPESTEAALRDLDVPGRWRPLLGGLLAPMPEDRFSTAEDALAALDALLGRAAARGRGSAGDGDGQAVAPRVLDDSRLVGRTAERARLAAMPEAARSGRPVVACLTGGSGMGKSRLLDEVADLAVSAGVSVLRAGAFDDTAPRPLAPFHDAFGGVAERFAQEPDRATRLAVGLGGALPAVLALAPELAGALDGAAEGPGTGSVRSEPTGSRGIVALAELMHDLHDRARPGVLLVDDCQWSDELSWRLLAALIRVAGERAGGASHLGIVLGMRPEGLPEVVSWGCDVLESVRLDPMPDPEVRALLAVADDRLPATVVERVVDRAGGSPLLALHTVRALWSTGVLRGAPGRWTVDEQGLDELLARDGVDGADPVDDDPAAALPSALVQQLPAALRRTVEQAAVLGRRFSVSMLAAASSRDPVVVRAEVGEAAECGLVRVVAAAVDGQWEFSHDRVRASVLRATAAETLTDLHAAAARAMAENAGAGYELAYHLARAGRPGQATPHALDAAEQALRHNALDVAESNLCIAADGLDDPRVACDDRTRFRVHEGMGTVHMLQGRYERAAAELELAQRASSRVGPLETARVAVSLGELAFKRGDVLAARTWFGHARRRLGHPDPGRAAPLRVVAELVLLCAILLGRLAGVAPRRSGRSGPWRALAARLDNRSGYLSWFTRRSSANLALTLRAMRLSLGGGSSRELAHSCALTAAVLAGAAPALSGWAVRLVDRSLRLRIQEGDDWGQAHSLHFRGFVLHAAGRYREAVVALDDAVERFDLLGDRWERTAASWQKALCLYRRGMVHEAGALARETYGIGARIGDRIGAGSALAVWARCLPFEVDAGTIVRELDRPDLDAHTETMLRAALGWKLLTAGEVHAAVVELTAAERCRRVSGLCNHFVAPTTTMLAQAVRVRLDRAPVWSPVRNRGLSRLRRVLRRARVGSLRFPAERPEVLRERAALRFARGSRRRALRSLERARRVAERRGAEGEAVACRALAVRALGGPRDAGDDEPCTRLRLRVDDGLVQARSLPVMGLIADDARHRAVLDAARRIIAAGGPEQILDELRTAVLTTVPALEVTVGPADDGEPSPTRSGPESVPGGRVRTEWVVRPLETGDLGCFDVRAELPLGEAARHEQSLDVLATLAEAVLERQALREGAAGRIAAVQEAERGRIARDLHDELGHVFVGVLEGLAVLDRRSGSFGDDRIEALCELARHGIRVVRSVAWRLRPEGLDELGVVACVEQLVDDCRRRSGIRIDFTAHVDQPIPSVAETAIFRVVQEALTNVCRHSGAAEASVLLRAVGERRLRVVVEDAGVGFDLDSPRGESLGLPGMHERAALVGGRVDVQTCPGAGTLVMLEVPLDGDRCEAVGDGACCDLAGLGGGAPWTTCDERCGLV